MHEHSATVEVMDTTLRDGEQTPHVSYMPAEKLQLARMLLVDVHVDRIEIASTRVSAGELESARMITTWAAGAGVADRVEILGYADGHASVDWILRAGGRAMNLLAKGSEQHCRLQLGMSPEAHRATVEATIAYARESGLGVNVYLEDWSTGVRASFDYVARLVDAIARAGAKRVYLADTLGLLEPGSVADAVGRMTERWPICFEFHGHNDYGLATANCLAAVAAGARGVHTSVNGLGERAGNAKLAEVVASLHDHTSFRTRVCEPRLTTLANLVSSLSGKDLAGNTPIVGGDVYTQTAGIHADGDAKGELYMTQLRPERFGGVRQYALGKLAGKASLHNNLQAVGIALSDAERDLVLARIVELGDRKHVVTQADLPYLVADTLKRPLENLVRIERYHVCVGSDEPPQATVRVAYGDAVVETQSQGDGGYDAFMRAVAAAVQRLGIPLPRLADFRVRIPPGGRSEALVETTIIWQLDDGRSFSTLAVDCDQVTAAVLATEKMLSMMAASAR